MTKLNKGYVTEEYKKAINRALAEKKTTKSLFMQQNDLPASFNNWSCGNKPNEKNEEKWMKLISDKLGV